MHLAHHPAAHDVAEPGMGRFFSPMNLDRFRTLASEATAAAERDRVLRVLAREWGAFKRESRALSETPASLRDRE